MSEDMDLSLTHAAFNRRNYLSCSNIRCNVVAALIVGVLDYFLTLKFEYTQIWARPYRSVKLLYVCSRYIGLISQVVHYTLIHTQLANAPVSTTTCQAWIFSMLSSAITLLLILDAVFLLRIYALYQKRRRTFWLLIPVAAQPLAVAICSSHSLFKEAHLNGFCDYKGSMIDAVGISTTIFVAHALLWVGTFLRRNIAQGQAVIVKLVVNESTVALALIFVPYASTNQRVCPFYIIPWLVTLIPLMCCRIVMNMHRLNVEPEGNDADRYVLSTVVVGPCNTISDLVCLPQPDKGPSKAPGDEVI